MLAKKQFDVLSYIAQFGVTPELAQDVWLSVQEAEAVMQDCTANGWLSEGKVTAAGLAALEPYRVKRAIFMAAGFGSRMVPITLNTPKPLVRVHGKRMIETTLDAVLAAGIPEIYVVRGYLGEQFDQLLAKYPMIKFIENPLYNKGNNIVSLLKAGELLQNSYILEADLVLSNPKLIRAYQYGSNYLSIPCEQTDDWCFHLEDGYINSVQIGGENCHQIIGISYWTQEDGARMAKHIKEVCSTSEGMQSYMSYVPFRHYHGQYKIAVRPCRREDIVEIDSFKELKEIDPAYDVE